MPDSTVQQAGGDFTNLATALADAGTGNGDTITIQGAWTVDDTLSCSISDNDITVIVNQGNASYHNGVYDESAQHYRLVVGDGNHCIQVDGQGDNIIDGLAIVQDAAGSSDEGIRQAVSTDSLSILNCIVLASTFTSGQDGIYAPNIDGIINAENCIIYGWGRAGCHMQNFSGGVTQTWNINSLTVLNCETVDNADGGAYEQEGSGGSTLIMNIFNSIGVAGPDTVGSGEDYNTKNTAATWSIDNCIDSDGSITDRDAGAVEPLEDRTATANPAPGVGDFVIFNNVVQATANLLLQDVPDDNDAQDAHSNTTGAGMTLPILDITAEVRERGANEIDIGADWVPPTPPAPSADAPKFGQPIDQTLANRPAFGQSEERVA